MNHTDDRVLGYELATAFDPIEEESIVGGQGSAFFPATIQVTARNLPNLDVEREGTQ